MHPPLTARQAEVLAAIRRFIAVRRYAPSIRDVAELMGGRQPNAAKAMLMRLERAGRISRADGPGGKKVLRSIILLDPCPLPLEATDGAHPLEAT